MRYGVHITPSLTSHWGTYDLMYDVSGTLLSANKLQIDSSLGVDGVTIDKQSNKLYAFGQRNLGAYPDSSQHSFLAAFDNTTRALIWKDTLANPYYALGKSFASIAADGSGHLYVLARGNRCFIYRGDTALNSLSTGSPLVMGIMKMDTSGHLGWMRRYSAMTGATGMGWLTMMPNNKIAACGAMAGTVVSGTASLNIYPGEGHNGFFTVIDSGGYLHTLQQLHGVGFFDGAYSATSDRVGNLYMGGEVENNIWAGTITPYASIGGNTDYFIMKYGVNCDCTSMPMANYTDTGNMVRGFTYTGTSAYGVDSVRWNFGDGATSTVLNPIHTYSIAGVYTAWVTVYTSCGRDMRCRTFTVSCPIPPEAAYTQTGIALTKSFAYTGSTAGLDSVKWDFGDGNTALGLTPSHTYLSGGTFHVCATVYTNCGSNTTCSDVIVSHPVSVVGITMGDIVVYPNPATNELIITCITGSNSYRILTIAGATLQTGTLHNGDNTLQLKPAASGTYILEITGKNGERNIVRVVKQ